MGDRLVLVALESRRARLVVLAATVAFAALLAVIVVRPAIAWYSARGDSIPALERALAWDPSDATLHLGLGYAYASLVPADVARATAHYDTAIRLRPTDARPRLLAALLTGPGHPRGAPQRKFIEEAMRLDPHNVTIRWEAALLYLEWGDRDAALAHLTYVLAVDPLQRDAAFHLARMLLRPGQDPGALLPTRPEQLTNVLLAALSHEDVLLAELAWTRRVPLEPPLPGWVTRRFMSLLLAKRDGGAARRAWLALMPEGEARSDAGRVWNGGFETERLEGWGLDWHVDKTWGAEVALDRFVAARGSRSLRVSFSSFSSLDFSGVSQFVAVEPGQRYRLRALAKASGFATQSGLKLEVVLPGRVEQWLAETPAITGTTAQWIPLETDVEVPPHASLVLLRVRRQPSQGPEGNLAGKVWLDEVTLR
jgi:tetratricopeptide (TPR) repeat protein